MANATVRIEGTGGQGVLVPGGYVLTAAHCIEWSGTGGMTLGDHYVERVGTKSGATFRLEPHAVEPVADIAALSQAEADENMTGARTFDEWQEATKAVPVSTVDLRQGTSRRVYVLAHTGAWLEGEVTRYSPGDLPSGRLWLVVDSEIEGGTSGGPIVDDAGHLVGVVSSTVLGEAGESGGAPFPVAHLALPRWVWAKIAAAQGVRGRARGR